MQHTLTTYQQSLENKIRKQLLKYDDCQQLVGTSKIIKGDFEFIHNNDYVKNFLHPEFYPDLASKKPFCQVKRVVGNAYFMDAKNSFPKLTKIDGNADFGGSKSTFEALHTIGGTGWFRDYAFDLPKLKKVKGTVYINSNTNFQLVERLHEIGAKFFVVP